MGIVRPFVKEDIPQIIDLNVKLFPASAGLTKEYQEYIFDRACLHNPWFDEQIRSLVYEESGGAIRGFLGVIPRKMSVDGKIIRAAVCQHLMVDQTALASLQLFKAILSGPQELTYSDRSAEIARRIWERVGGTTSMLNSFYWRRPVRPCTFLLNLVTRERDAAAMKSIMEPLCMTADAVINRTALNPFRREPVATRSEELTVENFLTNLPRFTEGLLVRPEYDEESLGWLFDVLEKEKRFGEFRKRAVTNSSGEMVGWFLYNLRQGGTSEVIQIAATERTIGDVLDQLIEDAWEGGASGLEGRLDPRFMKAFGDRRCFASPAKNWMVIHSRLPEIAQAIDRGNAFLSRLEGDLWFF